MQTMIVFQKILAFQIFYWDTYCEFIRILKTIDNIVSIMLTTFKTSNTHTHQIKESLIVLANSAISQFYMSNPPLRGFIIQSTNLFSPYRWQWTRWSKGRWIHITWRCHCPHDCWWCHIKLDGATWIGRKKIWRMSEMGGGQGRFDESKLPRPKNNYAN
jgi:hypothetical protein